LVLICLLFALNEYFQNFSYFELNLLQTIKL